jgi:thymidylate synthase (FAD)
MKIVNANAVLLDTSILTPYQIIEKAGRTCYKSEANITEDSAIKFTKNMLKNNHTAMLEHAHIYIRTDMGVWNIVNSWFDDYKRTGHDDNISGYLNMSRCGNHCYLSGSFRTFVNLFNAYFQSSFANSGIDALYAAISKTYPDIFIDKNSVVADSQKCIVFGNASDFIADVYDMVYGKDEIKNNVIMRHVVHTVVFTCDRGVSHEFVRHRPASFAQESSRYCNYSKDKFGSEITVIKPCFYDVGKDFESIDDLSSAELLKYMQYTVWHKACQSAEAAYFELLDKGSTPEKARSVLPNSLKTELVITATENEWQHIINLRYHGTTGKPHPQMVEVMKIAYPQLVKASDNRLN